MSGHAACPRCRKNRWKAIAKGAAWRCCNCGFVRKNDGVK